MTLVEYAQAYLKTRLNDLLQRASSIETSRKHSLYSLSLNPEDRSVVRGNIDVLDRLEATTRIEIAQTRHALERIHSGTYGNCEECGQPIKAARLHAVPEATKCSSCTTVSRIAA